MTDTTYNGWTNYPTWRVNLEYFDGCMTEGWEDLGVEQLAEYLQERVEEDVAMCSSGEAKGYAFAFLADVNWYEIAIHIYDEIQDSKVD